MVSNGSPIPGLAKSVFVVGEALVDVTVDVNGVEHRQPGGSPMNVAFGLARLGVPTRLMSWVGDDADGRLVAAHLRSAGVKLDDVTVAPRTATSTARATLDAAGAATYAFDLRWDLPDGGVPPECTVIHTGSIAAVLPPGADRVLDLYRSAAPEVIRSFDPNVRPAITPDRAAVLERVEWFVDRTDVLKLSDEDAAWLHPGEDEAFVTDWALGRGVKLFVMTRGAHGCTVATPSHRLEQPAIPTEVVDTIGAGDAFMSGLLAGLSRWGLFDALRRDGVGAGDLSRLAGLATRTASLTVAQVGAQPPTWTQVRTAA
ncbi:carbohydrate kinase family protein [Cellulomonas wangsupingiae]|uniref:carbohydrate kinase family protein n=1 Tax=Cellulomonas wangsupingiae TaxID=2968085 RepID=UPI001D0EFBA2|nr:carbohydrate kinase [Cellulomonas wangsupingiae]MCC2334568.1 carbohydrate kinase [Cellulomonas wangsupingiae]